MNADPKMQCLCPECGGMTEHEPIAKDGEPREIHIRCSRCGAFTATYAKEDGMWYIDGMHYIPEAGSNIATAFHRFDPSSYPDTRTAVEEGLGIVDGYERASAVCGETCRKRCAERRLELYRLGIDNGMDECIPDYISDSFLNALDEGSDAMGKVADEALALIEGLDANGLHLIVSQCYMISDDGEIANVVSRACDRIYELCMDGSRDSSSRVKDILSAAKAFKIVDDPRLAEVIRSGFELAGSIDDSDARADAETELCTTAVELADREGFVRIMDYMDSQRGAHLTEYVHVVLSAYSEGLIDYGDAEGLDRLNYCIDSLEKASDVPDEDGMHGITLMIAYKLRGRVTGDWKDTKACVSRALDLWEEREDPAAYMMIQDLFADDCMPRRERDALIRRARSMGIGEDKAPGFLQRWVEMHRYGQGEEGVERPGDEGILHARREGSAGDKGSHGRGQRYRISLSACVYTIRRIPSTPKNRCGTFASPP